MEGTLQQRRVYDLRQESVRAVRRFVGELAGDAGADADAVELLASELTTNAVIHANSGFEVRVCDDGKTFRVEIVNDAPEMIAAMREPSEGHGRGLHLVNAIAHRWVTHVDGGEKVVWFDLLLTESGPAPTASLPRASRDDARDLTDSDVSDIDDVRSGSVG